MPTIVKMDILGSTLTRGIFSNRYDSAVRKCIVKSDATDDNPIFTNVVGDFSAAIQAVIDAPTGGLLHPNSVVQGAFQWLLRVQRIQATRLAIDKMLVVMQYGRDATTSQFDPSLRASFRTGTTTKTIWRNNYREDSEGVTVESIDSEGYPSGDFLSGGNGLFQFPKPNAPHEISFSTSEIYVTINTSTNPYPDLIGWLDHINSDAVLAFGGYQFPPNTLLFKGVNTDFQETPTGPLYVTQLVFSALSVGWKDQQLITRLNQDGDFVIYVTINAPQYPTIDFLGFPL